jgi:cell division septum initiation protein DivIVA
MSCEPPRQATQDPGRRRTARPALLCAFAALLLGTVAPALASGPGAPEAKRLDAVLTRSAKLANRRLRPPAQRLARELPAEAKQIAALREPAATTQAQTAIALDELRQVSFPASLDPHYLPALVAAGRAFVAVSGQDPVTRTTINPEYTGIEAELAASEARLAGPTGDAGKVSAAVKRLRSELARAKRHARRLERRLRHAGTRRR